MEKEFGFYSDHLSVVVGDIEVMTLSGIEDKVAELHASNQIDGQWIYSPRQAINLFGGKRQHLPYAARVFGLPKTHVIRHAKADNGDHLVFLIWVLSFFLGVRFTTTEAGYLDSTPVTSGNLVDFALSQSDIAMALELADAFWTSNRAEPKQAQRYAAAIHALFLSQNPQYLQFEAFSMLYTAIDTCFCIAGSAAAKRPECNHHERIHWMCAEFDMKPPKWAGATVAGIRNVTIHEGLFMEAPLGFALHGVGASPRQNIILEMRGLVCRLLVALIGARAKSTSALDYIRTRVDTRQCHDLRL